MSEFADLPVPRLPDQRTIQRDRNFIVSADGRWVAVWCGHSMAGGIFNVDAAAWAIFAPIFAEKFAAVLAAQGIVDRNSDKFVTWLRAVRRNTGGPPVKQ